MAKITEAAALAFAKAFKSRRSDIDYSPLTDTELAATNKHAEYLLSLPGGKESKGL